MLNVKIQYFANLREKAGATFEEAKINKQTTLEELYTTLSNKYSFPLHFSLIKTAIGSSYVEKNYQISEGDVITFIPPVAGG